MTTLIIAKELLAKPVNVTYPDGKGNHQLTVSEVIDRFKEELPTWLDNFVNRLINTGQAVTNFGAVYSLEIEPEDPENEHYDYLDESGQLKSFDIQ